jgi:hypothetical protein
LGLSALPLTGAAEAEEVWVLVIDGGWRGELRRPVSGLTPRVVETENVDAADPDRYGNSIVKEGKGPGEGCRTIGRHALPACRGHLAD